MIALFAFLQVFIRHSVYEHHGFVQDMRVSEIHLVSLISFYLRSWFKDETSITGVSQTIQKCFSKTHHRIAVCWYTQAGKTEYSILRM